MVNIKLWRYCMTVTGPTANAPLPHDLGKNEAKDKSNLRADDKKIDQVFHETVPDETMDAKLKSIETDREFYIQETMKEKGVSREVAEAQVDFFY